MKKLSIITINYNDKIGLKKTFQSVLNQTFHDYEYIVIDGGSSDGSKELIEEYKDRISYWVSEPDKGIYNAMNKGIQATHSDFIIFMNSGDVFHHDKVLAEVENQLTEEFDIYYGDCYRVTPNASKRWSFPDKLSFSYFYSSSLSHQSTFIRRKLFYDFFLYNEDFKIVSDWEFFIYAICKMNVTYKHLNAVISDFDFTGISSNKKNKKFDKEEREVVFQKHFPLFVEDYKGLGKFHSKRMQQLVYVEEFPIAWKIMKGILNLCILLLPKKKKES
jgi:glycosyltransferase involved in cell wall biosynthesis